MTDAATQKAREGEKYRKMLESPVKPLIASLAVPSIASMLCTSFYNMADTYFVSKIDTTSTAAVGVTFATMAMLNAIGFFFGIGSGNSISRLLGARKRQQAEVMASTGFLYAFLCGLVIAVLGNLFAPRLATLIGSTPTILPYAIQYMGVILLGAPIMMSSLVMNNHLRFQGSAAFAMVGIMLGGFLNVLLDPIFIFHFHLGVAGAAYATILSQFVSFCILLFMTRQGGNIPIRLGNMHPSWSILKEIIAGGIPSLVRQGLGAVSTMVMNNLAGGYERLRRGLRGCGHCGHVHRDPAQLLCRVRDHRFRPGVPARVRLQLRGPEICKAPGGILVCRKGRDRLFPGRSGCS